MIGGDWPFVQRYISVPTTRDAKKSTYLIGILYLVTPLIWYLPTMIYRVMEPGLALDLDATTMTFNGEHAYVNMSKLVQQNNKVCRRVGSRTTSRRYAGSNHEYGPSLLASHFTG